MYFSLVPSQLAEGQPEGEIVPQPSSSPATTCGSWYWSTGSCAYYTFGCDYSQVLNSNNSQESCDVCSKPWVTWPVCFTGSRQSPINLREIEATISDPGSLTLTGYNNILGKNPVIRTQGYGLQMDLEATVSRDGTKNIEAPISYNRKDKDNIWKGTTQKRKKKNSKRKKHKKRGRNKREFLDWLYPSSSRQQTSLDIPSITGGPLMTGRSVQGLGAIYPRPNIAAQA